MWVGWGSGPRLGDSPRLGARVLRLAALALLCGSSASFADPTAQSAGREVWAGADISSNVWLVYSGVTYSPWGGMHDPGWRFRAAGGYGEYSYSDRVPGARAIEFDAQTYFADFFVGYQTRIGELTAKAFVGPSVISHDIEPFDTETIAIGDETGIKGVIELWLNIGASAWGSLDLSWSSAHNTRAARARVGYRVWQNVSLGLEGGLNVDSQGECRIGMAEKSACKTAYQETVDPAGLLDYGRAGAFARYEWNEGEVSLSAGVLGDSFASDGSVEIAPYTTLNWLTRF
jgi:hypothetical protein